MPTVSDLKQQARALEQRGQLGKALAVYQHILKHLEGTPAIAKVLPLYVKVGDLLLRQDRAEEAVAAYMNAAEQYAEHGSAQRVSALCEKIQRIAPDRRDTHVRFAHRLMTHGHVGSARDVLAEYAERAQLERVSEVLDDLAGRPSDEIRPILEPLLKSLQHGEKAGSESDVERVSSQLSQVTDAAAGELTGMAVMDMATPPPESGKRSAYTFDLPETQEERRSGEPDPLAPQLIDFGAPPDLPATPATKPPAMEIEHETPAPDASGERPGLEIEHKTPGPEMPDTRPGLEIDHKTPAPEAPAARPGLEIDHKTPAPKTPDVSGLEIEHRTPAPEAPDMRPATETKQPPPTPQSSLGGGPGPPAAPPPASAPPPTTAPPGKPFEHAAPPAERGPEAKPAGGVARGSALPERGKPEPIATPRVTTPRVTAPTDTGPRPTAQRPRPATRSVLRTTQTHRPRSRPVVPALAGFAAGVVVTAVLFLSGIVPRGGGGPDTVPTRSEPSPAPGGEMPAAMPADPTAPVLDSVPDAALLADTGAPATPPDTAGPAAPDAVGGLADPDSVRADAIPEPVVAGAAAVPPASGDSYPIVVEGLDVESISEIEFRGQAGYRVVHLLDSGDPLTVESYYIGGDTGGTARVGRIVVNVTPPDTAVGMVRLERYMVYASGVIPEDSLRTLMIRLVELEGSD